MCQKNYVMSNEIESLIQILPFSKPTVRSDAPKTVDALEKIHTLETSRSRYVNSVYSHEKMHRNVICTWSVIFSTNNGPTAVLYSITSYVAFTR